MVNQNDINETLAYAIAQYGYDRSYKVRFDYTRPFIEVYEDPSDTIVGYVFRRNGELVKHNATR